MWWVPAQVDKYQTGKRKKMDSTNTKALRVVLGVTEISAVAEMDSLRKNTERLMTAYHFQQTMRRFAEGYLDRVNSLGAVNDYGKQRIVNIIVNILPVTYDVYPMLFVEPTLGHDSYIYLNDYDCEVYIADLDGLASFFCNHPYLYDAFLDKAMFSSCRRRTGDYNTPDDGIIAF